MSSLIANQVETNMCSVSVELFIVLTTIVSLFTLKWYNYNLNEFALLSSLFLAHNYSLLCLQPFCKR